MDQYKEKVKDKIKEELNTDYAKENIQMLLTVVQILAGILVTIAFLSFGATLEDNYWIAAGALFLTILLPSSSKIKSLCSSEFLRKFRFYIFKRKFTFRIRFFYGIARIFVMFYIIREVVPSYHRCYCIKTFCNNTYFI